MNQRVLSVLPKGGAFSGLAVAASRIGLTIFPCSGHVEAIRELGCGDAPALVLHASLLRDDAFGALLEAVDRVGSPLIVCADASAAPVTRLLQSASRCPAELVRLNEERALPWARLLRRLPEVSMPSRVLSALAPQILLLPFGVRRLLLDVWCPPDFHTRSDTRIRFGSSPPGEGASRSVERALALSGLSSLTSQSRAARLAHAYDLLDDEENGLTEIAVRCGLRTERTLSNACQSAFGTSPRRVLHKPRALRAAQLIRACGRLGERESL